MDPAIAETLTRVTGARPLSFTPLSGGCVSDVMRVDLDGGARVVIKIGDSQTDLDLEAYRLRYLAENSRLPVPEVIHADPGLLVISHVETRGGITSAAQAHAAELLADLHGITADAYGFDHGTLTVGLAKPAPWTGSWLDFYREHRLWHMSRAALNSGNLPPTMMPRLEKLIGRVEQWLYEPDQPALIHGDMWTGNVLCHNGRVAAFIDPSCYYAHEELELAYSTLFGTFDTPFFQRYHELRPIRPGFFEERRHLYNLYHLLIHVRLFAGPYVGAVDETLRHYGF